MLGWTDSHAHEFEVGDALVAPNWWIQEAFSADEESRYRDERRVSIAAVVSELGPRGEFRYLYDMGMVGNIASLSNPRRTTSADLMAMPRSWTFSVIVTTSSTRTPCAGSAGSSTRKGLI